MDSNDPDPEITTASNRMSVNLSTLGAVTLCTGLLVWPDLKRCETLAHTATFLHAVRLAGNGLHRARAKRFQGVLMTMQHVISLINMQYIMVSTHIPR
jgi:hypothetical protein